MEGDSLVEEELVVGGHVLEMLEAHADVVTLVPVKEGHYGHGDGHPEA